MPPRAPRATPIVAGLVLAIGVITGAGENPRLTADEVQRSINDLFTAAYYDSILHVIPGYIQRAEAENDSVLLGRMYAQRGRTLTMIGRGAEGIHDIDLGIRLAEAARDTVGWMPAVHYKGYYYSSEGRFDDALRCFEKRLELATLVHSPLDEALARSSIGYVYTIRGDYARAKEHYTLAILLFRQSAYPEREATPLIGLGRIEGGAGNEAEARACFQRAWVVARASGDRVNEMWATNNLGVLEATEGDPGRAAAYSQRAFDIAKEIDYPPGMVIPATNLAARAKELGDFARAESILTDAREVCLTRGASEFLSMVDFSLAELRLLEGRYQAAGATFRRLLATSGQLEPQHKYFAIIGLGRVLAHDDSVSQAIDLLTDNFEAKGVDVYALAEPEANLVLSRWYEQTDNPEAALRHARRAIDRAQALGWRRVAVTARLRESVCYRTMGRHREAYASLLTGLDSLDSVRGGITAPEWREAYGQGTSRDLVDAGRVLLEYPDDLPMRAREKAFFDSMQRFKTRSLLDRISEPRTGAERTEHALRPAATIDDLQSDMLRPGELLLEFFVGGNESYLVAVARDDLRLVKLPGPDSALAESIELYHHALASADPALQADFPAERLAPLQRSLGTALMGGVADMVERAQTVLVAPDGFFASIPFGTLILTDPSRMLMETRPVVQIPSASVLALQRSQPVGRRAGVARIVALEASKASNLPGAHDEVRDLSRRYSGVERVQGLSGGAAGLASIAGRCDVLHIATHALIVDNSPWQSGLALAPTPGGAGDSIPSATATRGRSSIDGTAILSSADSALVARTFQDPFVRAWQIANLSLPTTLTVLAGCETAGGRLTTGEGVLGLTAAFVSAGVPVVVSSLWPIDDRATVRVMEHFYQHLAKGESVATSLRLAQLAARDTGGHSHPFYWAGFTVVGDGSIVVNVEERSSRLRVALLAVLALGLVGATIALLRRRRPRFAPSP